MSNRLLRKLIGATATLAGDALVLRQKIYRESFLHSGRPFSRSGAKEPDRVPGHHRVRRERGQDGLREMSRPRIALVGWRLGGEFESLIKQGHDRFRYVVVSMVLPEEIRPLVEWHRIPLLRWPSFRLRWVIFFLLGGLRIMRLHAAVCYAVFLCASDR
jgi:hypothetical protein